ncbi:carbohydrate ABC transporter permease [Vallitalea maricola]|uniref:Sugar ABC transporter permease n=1 Tax=Vallitalea maricola TaxID=3074433 RepID=A0ACB5UG97_9FIRM|nr:sugar ABC transporter permease [Vallitalea sp. AN17-2]
MKKKKNSKEIRLLLLFLLPALIFYSLFMIIPVITGLSYSFTDWNGLNPNYNFVGLKNFIDAITKDKNFLISIKFTLKYVLAMVILTNVIGLLLAVLIDSRNKSKNIFRTVFFVPNMISFIIGAYIWQFIFRKVFSELAQNNFLGFLDQPWLGNPNFSFLAIVMMSLWTTVGYTMVIYIAAIQGVPTAYKEAAKVDGASSIKIFFKVTLPMIMHAVTINLFLTLNGSFKAFDQIYGLTGGGPGRTTQVMSLNIYEEAFSSYFRYGYANAKAIILFLFVLCITLIQLRITRKKEVKA